MNWKERLNNAKGLLYLHNRMHERIVRFKEENEDEVTIVTDQDDYTISKSDVKEFLQGFHPVAEDRLLPAPSISSVTNSRTFQAVGDALLNNIEKLQGEDGHKYLDQAKEISNQSNSLINLVKTELDAIKTAQSIQNNGLQDQLKS